MTLLQEAAALAPRLVAHRRTLHQNPEVGMELPNTQGYVMEQLTAMGYQPKRLGASIVALAGSGSPVLLLRADMDALPIAEQTGLDFASTNGCMHACGHDFHTAMLLGAAQLLKDHEAELHGTVKLLFQAGEEVMGGALEAIEEGVLENPKVDAAVMQHVYTGFPIPIGLMATAAVGASCASTDLFTITVKGKGGHGAMPEQTVSPISVLCAIHSGIAEIMANGVPSSQQCIMTVGHMQAGDAANVIPDSGFMRGTIRAFDEDLRADLKQKLVRMAEGAAAARGASVEVDFSDSAPCLVSDKEVAGKTLRSLKDLLGEKGALDMGSMGPEFARTMGSEDFAYIAQRVPSAMMRLMAGDVAKGYVYPGHHPKANYDESALPIGTAAYAKVALDWLAE